MINLKLQYQKIKLNNTYVKTFLVTDFPSTAVPGLLYGFTHGEFVGPEKNSEERISVNIAMHIRKASVNFDWKMNNKMNRLQHSIESYHTGRASDTPREEEAKALEAIMHLRSSSSNFAEVFLFITISSEDNRMFRRRTRMLKNFMKNSGFKYNDLKLEQHTALTAAWAGGNKEFLNKYHGRIMDKDSLAAFYPFLDGTTSHKTGAYIGHRISDGTATYKDVTSSPDDQNIMLTGTTGSGKSNEIKNIVESLLNVGLKGYVYDVDGEYFPLCKKVGGQWVDLTVSSGKFVDPTYIEPSIFDEIDPKSLDPISFERAKEADNGRMQEAINNTLGINGLLVDDFTIKKRNAAEYALLTLWQEAGIKEDDPSTWSKRKDLGIHNLYEMVKENANSKSSKVKHKEGAKELEEDLWSYFEGGNKKLFKNATTSDFIRDSKLTVFHVASSVDNPIDQKMGAIKIVMASQMVWQQVKRDLLKKEIFSFGVYDELQRLIKNPYAAASVYRDITTGRKFNYQTILGFNDPSILFPGNEGLWNNTKYKLLFSLEKNTIDKLAEYGAMPQEVIEHWLNLGQYQFILNERTKDGKAYDILRAELPQSELKLYKTRGLD